MASPLFSPLLPTFQEMPASNMNKLLRSPRLLVIGILAFSLLSIHSVLHRQQIFFQGILRQDTNYTGRNSATRFKAIPKTLEAVRNSTLGVSGLLLVRSAHIDMDSCSFRRSSSSTFPNAPTSSTLFPSSHHLQVSLQR